jgi:hypothetical protein
MKMNKLGLERALENIQLRPGFWGMGYDFKPHLMKLVRKLRYYVATATSGLAGASHLIPKGIHE